MPYTVTLPLDAAAAAHVERMWRALAAQAGDDDAIRLGYAPHITLAVLPDAVSATEIGEAACGAARSWEALTVVLADLGVFPGTPPVIWAAPVVTQRLLAQHASLYAALTPLPVHPHYQPGSWVPHITLNKKGLISAARAIEIVASVWEGR